jgi:methylglyoxal synthase
MVDTRKRIALIAHDKNKKDLLDWILFNREKLSRHSFWSSGTTGKLIEGSCPDLDLIRLKSGPLGGDQQVGAMIAEGRLDMLIFFIDPLSPQPHDVDVKALTRLSTLYDIPFAHNRSADFIISSPLFEQRFERSTSEPQGEFDRLLGAH